MLPRKWDILTASFKGRAINGARDRSFGFPCFDSHLFLMNCGAQLLGSVGVISSECL